MLTLIKVVKIRETEVVKAAREIRVNTANNQTVMIINHVNLRVNHKKKITKVVAKTMRRTGKVETRAAQVDPANKTETREVPADLARVAKKCKL
jgi:hypothetical protein